MTECQNCKAQLESDFGIVVCHQCGYTNIVGVTHEEKIISNHEDNPSLVKQDTINFNFSKNEFQEENQEVHQELSKNESKIEIITEQLQEFKNEHGELPQLSEELYKETSNQNNFQEPLSFFPSSSMEDIPQQNSISQESVFQEVEKAFSQSSVSSQSQPETNQEQSVDSPKSTSFIKEINEFANQSDLMTGLARFQIKTTNLYLVIPRKELLENLKTLEINEDKITQIGPDKQFLISGLSARKAILLIQLLGDLNVQYDLIQEPL